MQILIICNPPPPIVTRLITKATVPNFPLGSTFLFVPKYLMSKNNRRDDVVGHEDLHLGRLPLGVGHGVLNRRIDLMEEFHQTLSKKFDHFIFSNLPF